MSGKYQPIEPNEQGWLWSEQLGLYLGIYEKKLRYFTPDGELALTYEEYLIQARERKKLGLQQQEEAEKQQKQLALQREAEERQQKELAEQKLAEMNAKLKELGIELD